jgi:cation diffusion facilitator family transporter
MKEHQHSLEPEHDHEGGTGHGHHHHHDHDPDPDYEDSRGPTGIFRSIFSPHSHDASESIASALETSTEAIRALKLSLLGLAATALFQVIIVATSGSVALLGDTIHNFSDALTAIPLGIAFWLGRRAPTKRYTYGYGRAEDLAGIFIVAMIALSAGVAGWEALRRFFHPQQIRNLGWVAIAGLAGFVGNELVALYRIRVGRKIGSAALVADGVHARTDGLTSLAVVVGVAGAAAGWPLADPIVGLLITAAIVVILKGAAKDIYRRLMDSVDPELVDYGRAVLAKVPGIEGVDELRIRWVGHQLWAEAEVVSDCDLTITQGHDIAEEAHHSLLHEIPRLARATIHTSPCSHDGGDHHARTAHHLRAAEVLKEG